ncbi:uncharacterized protein LOC117112584 [Anneissia japonica]|uniref:uncharacterized protein LOC117112584 n=1 Tax=Anneissia japonica TaxID=1529436 RepID=UPI0014256427|nr:uncharacterized protein LOC117112584 [Anneissia japonica]
MVYLISIWLLVVIATFQLGLATHLPRRGYVTHCEIQIHNAEKLTAAFEKRTKFIHVKLNFGEKINLQDNTSDVVDAYHWVWVVGSKGKFLLSLPFDFPSLSLGTLSLRLDTVRLNASLPPDSDCFKTSSDSDKLAFIAKALLATANELILRESEVCLEKHDRESTMYTYYNVLQGQMLYECWNHQDDYPTTKSRSVRPWMKTILLLAFIVSLYFPLLLKFFMRSHPESKIYQGRSVEYLSFLTDIPTGPKYWLFFKGNSNNYIYIARCLIYLFLFILLQFLPYIIAFVTDKEDFYLRWEAVVQNGNSAVVHCIVWYVLSNSIFTLFVVGMIITLNWKSDWFERIFIEDSYDRTRISLDLFDLPDALKIPNDPYSGLKRFFYVLQARAEMLVRVELWESGYYGIKIFYKFFKIKLGKGWSVFIIVTCFLPYCVVFLLIVSLNCIPFLYCFMRMFQVWLTSTQISKSLQLMLLWILFIFVEVILLGKCITIMLYLIEIIGYTFTGMIINAGALSKFYVFIIGIVAYILSVLNSYTAEYSNLLFTIIEIAKKVLDKNLTEVETNKNEDRVNRNFIRMDSQVICTNQSYPLFNRSMMLNPPPAVMLNSRNFVSVQQEVFEYIAQKYKPFSVEITLRILRVVLYLITLVLGFSLLCVVNSFEHLTVVQNLFASAGIVCTFPILCLMLQSKQSCLNQEAIMRHMILRDIESFMKDDAN